MLGWKTIQFFVSLDEICEVQISHSSELRCTCKGYVGRKNCRHSNWCRSKLSRGEYPIEITKDIPEEELKVARESNEAFRNIVLKYGKPLPL
jgi:hypothetical protein